MLKPPVMLTTIEKTNCITGCVAEVGQDIGLQEGTAMINRYRELHPEETVTGHTVGRNIIEQILAQPGCEGINIYYALNHLGQRQLVFMGADQNGRNILEFNKVDDIGQIQNYKGIVADRMKPSSADTVDPITGKPRPGQISSDDFMWEI